MVRSCATCDVEFQAKTSRAKYCSDRCKRRYHRGARAASSAKKPAKKKSGKKETSGKKSEADGIQSTEAATMLALADAGKLGTPSGQAALVLSRRIDASHLDTGAGLASMVKRLQETVDALTSDAKLEDDPVDELRARREAKATSAASG